MAVLDMAILALALIELVGVHIVVPMVMVQHNGVISNSNPNRTLKRRNCGCTSTEGVVVNSSTSTSIRNRSFKALESKRQPNYKSQELV